MRVRLKGVHRVTKKLASGVRTTYVYAWRGGPRITAPPGTEEFLQAVIKARAARTKSQPGIVFNLVAEFRHSAEFPKAESTRRAYRAYLREIEERFGDMPIAALSDPAVRGEFLLWRDELAATPRKADYAWTVLARVLSVAKNRGRISVNPCERAGRLYMADRAERIWTSESIQKFCAAASPELQNVLLLALWTGQRQGDLLRLTWAAYDSTHIRLRQRAKGRRRGRGRHVVIPVGGPLQLALDAWKAAGRKSTNILVNSKGRPWTSDGFRASWAAAFGRAGLDDLHFHDLRGTAVTRLALAGCTVPEIAAITGHSLKDVEAILDAHYLGGRVELAEAAIAKLNAAYGG